MFHQLVAVPHDPTATAANAAALFEYHPMRISALIETYWGSRAWPAGFPFDPWPPNVTTSILAAFGTGLTFATPTSRDHLIYAYLIENTRIFDIFAKVLETYQVGEQLETPSPAGQRFWRNTESLIYSDPSPLSIWNVSGRTRPDETASRMSAYWWMFGMDLSHARDLAQKHPYAKPAATNRDFVPTFETFGREVWRGIMNAQNTSGPNPSDAEIVATSARRIYDMFITRRRNGNMSREEFRAVSVMSWLHLAVSFNSQIVQDLRAEASSPEERLAKIAERVGMRPHSKAKAFFDLAHPFSLLLQAIETGSFNQPSGASALFNGPLHSASARIVIDQYSLATGRDLKAGTVVLTQQAMTPPALPSPPRAMPIRAGG